MQFEVRHMELQVGAKLLVEGTLFEEHHCIFFRVYLTILVGDIMSLTTNMIALCYKMVTIIKKENY